MIGKTISHYKILEELGRGGMGVVYKAQDTKLHRTVALKFLHSQAIIEEEDKKRFSREAQAAAALNHPNICTIHEINEADGHTFIAMEFVEGVSIRERIKAGPLSLSEILEIAVQASEGLRAAHKSGVIHRDIKSANLMITPEGRVKVMDFGLAMTAGATRVTKTGTTLGTAAYMSPEQALGQATDSRTDIWSLGVVLYEMLAGQMPFKGDYDPALMYAIAHEEPEPITTIKSGVPLEAERVVGKALAKNPDKRYQSAADLKQDLEELRESLDLLPRRSKLQLKLIRLRRRIAFSAAAVIVVAALAILGIRYFAGSARAIDSIAVLPLVNVSGDPEQEYLVDGMTDALIGELAQISALRVISRTSAMQYKKTSKPLPEIAQELNVDAVVEGTVLLIGESVRITVELIYAPEDRHLWANTYEYDLDEILKLHANVAQAIASKIEIKLTKQDQTRLQSSAIVGPAAYKAYLMGKRHSQDFTSEAWRKGIEYFNQAIDIDVTFAPAYAGLARCYGYLDWFHSDANYLSMQKAAISKALELDPNLAEAHAEMAVLLYQKEFDWDAAEREFRRAIDLKPSSYSAHKDYGLFLSLARRFDEAFPELIKARDLDPLIYEAHRVLGLAYVHSFRWDEGIAYMLDLRERFPGRGRTEWFLALCFSGKGMHEQAIAIIDSLEAEEKGWKRISAGIYAAGGRVEEALQIVREREQGGESESSIAGEYFFVYTASGRNDEALSWAEKLYELSPVLVMYFNVVPLPPEMRADPRFQDLMRRVGLGE